MRIPAAISVSALLIVCANHAGAQSPLDGLERVHFLGREYVRLRDWARANDFDLRRLRGDTAFELSNRWHRFVFNGDSREAELDGVKVWLSFPVAVRGGQGYAASLDFQTAVQPVLSLPKNPGGAKIRTIVLDPGHGGKDAGNRNGRYQEKTYTLLLAQETREQLKLAGFNVTLTRSTDKFIEPATRPEMAKGRGADLFLSLHFNASPSARNEVKGVELYCFTPAGASSTNARGEGTETRPSRGNRHDADNMLLAYQLHKSLVKNLAAEDRGIRRARWAVLRDADMPAVLVEGGFLSHPNEGRRIIDPAYRREMARAIVDGVIAYQRTMER